VESPIIVDELVADGALLRIIPRRQGKDPKEFAIQALTMRTLGYGQEMPFVATLTNPIPKGQIETGGTFGPWQKGDPGSTPLGGQYTFQNADLDTIKGIGGILASTGSFTGVLERIAVTGEARIPDFHLDISQQPVSLTSRFETVVDGTDGDTYLNKVDAQFLTTSLTAKGAVTGTKGVKGRTITLNVRIGDGRIEGLLRLAAENVVSDLSGRLTLKSGSLSFADLAFGLPGALVRLRGSYGLRSEALAFDGTLRMEATISEAAGGGIKGFPVEGRRSDLPEERRWRPYPDPGSRHEGQA
jgi:hypothetical protein